MMGRRRPRATYVVLCFDALAVAILLSSITFNSLAGFFWVWPAAQGVLLVGMVWAMVHLWRVT